jgi:hypothetical protein
VVPVGGEVVKGGMGVHTVCHNTMRFDDAEVLVRQ